MGVRQGIASDDPDKSPAAPSATRPLRHLAESGTQATVVRLREAGWLDWQILVALVNVALNWRMNVSGIQFGTGDPSTVLRLARQPETPDSQEIPIEIFADADIIDLCAHAQLAAVARTWGLHGRTEAPNEEAMVTYSPGDTGSRSMMFPNAIFSTVSITTGICCRSLSLRSHSTCRPRFNIR